MPPIETTNSIRQKHPASRVYTRRLWSDDWEEQPYLYCDSIEFVAAPGIGRASMTWVYGRGLQPDQTEWKVFEPKSLDNYYVKIEVDQPPSEEVTDPEAEPPLLRWYGVIVSDARRLSGDLMRDGERTQTGIQQLAALDMSILLARTYIDRSWVERTSTTEQTHVVPMALDFNVIDGQRGPNASGTTDAADSQWRFSPVPDETWDAFMICDYLLARFMKDAPTTWKLDSPLTFFDGVKPAIATEGRTVFEVINQAIDRRSLYGWHLVADTNTEGNVTFKVTPFTFTDEEIDLGGATIPANTPDSLDFGRAIDIIDASVVYDGANVYGRVVVRGEVVTNTFTVTGSGETPTLIPSWPIGDEVSYDFDNIDENNLAWRWYSIPDDWDGTQGYGEEPAPALCTLNDADEPIYQEFVPFSARIERTTRIATGNSNTVEYWPLTAFAPVYNEADEVAGWVDLRTANQVEIDIDGLPTKQGTSATVRTLEDRCGLDIFARPQHGLAGEDYTEETPDFDYRDIYVTVTLPINARVEAAYPQNNEENLPVYEAYPPYSEGTESSEPSVTPIESDIKQTLYITMPDARLDILLKGTVTGVDGTDLYAEPETINLRDDRDEMRRVAKLAHRWFSRPRRQFSFAYRQLTEVFRVGQMISTLRSGDKLLRIDGVVTAVRYDLLNGATSIQTDHGELDITRAM